MNRNTNRTCTIPAAEALRFFVALDAGVDGRVFFLRSWDESFPRNLL
jgi:hypothetical protein